MINYALMEIFVTLKGSESTVTSCTLFSNPDLLSCSSSEYCSSYLDIVQGLHVPEIEIGKSLTHLGDFAYSFFPDCVSLMISCMQGEKHHYAMWELSWKTVVNM